CTGRVTDHLVDNHTDGAYTVLRFVMDCPKESKTLDLGYSLFFDLDPTHRGLLRLEYQGQTRTAIFSPDQAIQRFELAVIHPWRQLLDFGHEGVWHIWIGFDHILFLLSLLLPSVLKRESGHWQAVLSFRVAFWDVLKIVTAFTLAHSITLSLASLGIVQLPSRWVESGIAASIVLAALNNIYPLFVGRRWIVAFAFGLIHGFGFASVLMDLGLPQGALLMALVGFNLGVEAGQLAIVSVFLPLAYGLRFSWFYQRLTLVLGSFVVITLASIWMVERMFNLKLLAF
ncbi:MAG: HupE/UreJ family protein, partial [Nitrospirae bacterium]|nr:HupE/UreJ family protein [Nitrospirota bacterium]